MKRAAAITVLGCVAADRGSVGVRYCLRFYCVLLAGLLLDPTIAFVPFASRVCRCDMGVILYHIWQTSLVILLRRKFYSRLLYYHVCKHVTFNNSVHYKFSHFLVVSVPQAAWDRNYKFRPLTRFFDGGPPSHLPRCTDIIHVMNSPSPSPFLHTASDQKTAQWEGLRTRLV